jgi:hypothetical protein
VAGRDVNNINYHYHLSPGSGSLDVPLLEFTQLVSPQPEENISDPGIALQDCDPTKLTCAPTLIITIQYKTRPFYHAGLALGRCWLWFQVDMRPAFSLGIQIRLNNQHEQGLLLECLRGQRAEMALQTYRMGGEDLNPPNYLRIWGTPKERRLSLVTFTTTGSAIGVQARLAPGVVDALADYLVARGFETFGPPS